MIDSWGGMGSLQYSPTLPLRISSLALNKWECPLRHGHPGGHRRPTGRVYDFFGRWGNPGSSTKRGAGYFGQKLECSRDALHLVEWDVEARLRTNAAERHVLNAAALGGGPACGPVRPCRKLLQVLPSSATGHGQRTPCAQGSGLLTRQRNSVSSSARAIRAVAQLSGRYVRTGAAPLPPRWAASWRMRGTQATQP